MPNPVPDLSETRLARRLVLHLARLPRLGPDDTATLDFTQPGIAEATLATQGAVAKIVSRLTAAGVLKEERRHVVGWPRRLTVYTLTWKGESLASDLEARLALPPTQGTRPVGRPRLGPDAATAP